MIYYQELQLISDSGELGTNDSIEYHEVIHWVSAPVWYQGYLPHFDSQKILVAIGDEPERG